MKTSTLQPQEKTTEKHLSPSEIMKIGMGFWPSKVLLTAVHHGLFTHLAEQPRSLKEIKNLFGWNCTDRHASDFLDTLFTLKFLQREGIGSLAVYSNAEETDLFLDKNKPTYIGGILEMANNRLYPFWANLSDGLKSGKAQNEIRNGGENLFEAIYASPEKLKEFIKAMSGVSLGNFMVFADRFDFAKYKTLCDIGGSGAVLSLQVATRQPHMSCISFDLPPVEPIAQENISRAGMNDRVKTAGGDFFKDPFPKADIITMSLILHDWNEKDKRFLIKKAYDALPSGGALVVIENIIDDQRSQNVFGLTMSLNMLIETGEGFDFTLSDFTGWAKEIGFTKIDLLPLAGPTSAGIAYK